MRALWAGISHPDITWAGPVPVDVGGFLHVLGQSAINPPEKFWDKTYAIVGANYVNYACRLGYHFQSVDSYIGDIAADNYINFTFKGGAADDVRRVRRIRLIATVLERLGFADVRNHLATERLRQVMGTDLFYWHGFTEIRLEGRWVKATPAFDAALCERANIKPLDFDRRTDSLFQPFDPAGRKHMEYLRDRGSFADVPAAEIQRAFREFYPKLYGLGRDAARETFG